MSRRNVVSFYTAPARSGKTYRMVMRICDEMLPLTKGMIYTNLPLYPEKIAAYCRDTYKLDYEETLSRLHIIPRDIELSWREAGKPIYDAKSGRKTGAHPLDGPWTYFHDKPLAESTIIIDEIHNFCGSIGTPKPVSNQWQSWLGELGHSQAIFLCISQSPAKVHNCIKQEAQASYLIRNTGLDRDPYFKIEVYDWLELFSGLFGMEYKVFVFEQEIQKNEGRAAKGERKLHLMGQPYFSFYDSFNQPIANAQAEDAKPFEHEYEKHLKKGFIRGRLSLLKWFIFKNFYAISSRGAIAVAACVLILYLFRGGAGDITRYLTQRLSVSTSNKSGEAHAGEPILSASSSDESRRKELEARLNELYAQQNASREPAISSTPSNATAAAYKAHEEEMKKVLLEREKARVEMEAARRELESMNAMALITPSCIVLKKGQKYEIGQEIGVGEFKGRRLESIDYRRREAILDDGSVLRLSD